MVWRASSFEDNVSAAGLDPQLSPAERTERSRQCASEELRAQRLGCVTEVENLHKAFGRQAVLRGVSLDVPEGTTCVLLGGSGSGKTVLLKHLLGLLQPDRGRVVIDGRDLARLSPPAMHELRLELGILFQAGALFDSMTVFDNVAFPLKEQLHLKTAERQRRVRDTLELVGLSEAANELPGELSGGMRKRVAFARAIVTQPKILLFDEPTAGLDPLSTRSVSDEILLAKNELHVTQFAITHDLPTAFRVADTIALLDDGVIAAHAEPDEFRRSAHPAVQTFLHEWLKREEHAAHV
jgi:phospholipid/cholesterol/gamma-HCH transport system ATP-binding protein